MLLQLFLQFFPYKSSSPSSEQPHQLPEPSQLVGRHLHEPPGKDLSAFNPSMQRVISAPLSVSKRSKAIPRSPHIDRVELGVSVPLHPSMPLNTSNPPRHSINFSPKEQGVVGFYKPSSNPWVIVNVEDNWAPPRPKNKA